ncbi:hypothetical protein WR25_22260 [Diploscapter pachys]|uniref:Bromodomain associated domain-containing protein n=1 Tax=Diploscapter pachys TaxID=2018661 RepID=A0A2A2M2K2_9BILA|nr:hypothetical protein WR25_22260 [Diploscapter pachys]
MDSSLHYAHSRQLQLASDGDFNWRTRNAIVADRHGFHHRQQLVRPKDIAAECMSLFTSSTASLFGFSQMSSLTQDMLQSIAIQYIKKMCQQLKWTMEHCGREYPTANDMQFVYRRMQIDVGEMSAYMEKVKPLKPPIQVK